MPDFPEINDEDRAASAKFLGLTKYLPAIDAIPMPADQASPGAKNIDGIEPATKYQVPDISIPAPQTRSPSGSSWLDNIPNAIGGWQDKIPDAKTSIQKSYDAASGTDADRNAKVLKLSQQSGQDPAFVDNNLKRVEAASNKISPELFDRMERDYPGSMKFYSKDENMAAAHDDVPNVMQHEGLIKGVTTAHSLLNALNAGFQDSVLGRTVRAKGPDTSLSPDATELERLAFQAGSFVNPLDLGIMGAGGIMGGAAGATAGSVLAPVAGTIAGGIAGAGAGAFGLEALIKTAISEQQKNGDPKSIQDGLDRIYAIGKETAKQMGVGALTSIAGEAAAPLGIAAKLAAEVGTMTVVPKAIDDQEVERRDVGEGLLMVGGLYAAGAGAGHFLNSPSKVNADFQRAIQEEKINQTKNFLTALGDTAEASKLRERLPDTHKALVDQLTADGPVSHVYIPAAAADAYFQSKGLDPGAEMNRLGVRASYEEAKKTGGDVQIPLSTVTDKLVGTEHYQGLLNDMKLSADDVTLNQSAAAKEAMTADMQRMVDTQGKNPAAEKLAADQAAKDDSVKSIFKQRFLDAGMSQSEAQANAEVSHAVLTRMSQHFPNFDAEAIAREYPLQVRGKDGVIQGAPLGEEASGGNGFNQGVPIESQLQTDIPLRETRPNSSFPADKAFEGMDGKGIRAIALERAKNEIPRGPVENEHTGWKINVSSEGLKKSADYATRPEQALALSNIHDLIKNGEWLRSEGERGKPDSKVTYQYLYSPFESEGKQYIAKIGLREVPGKDGPNRSLYTLHAQEVKKTTSESPDYTPGGGKSPASGTVNKADLLGRVNEARQKTTFFQGGSEETPAPPFFSKLTKTVEEKMGGSATPEQINGMLREIKPEERKWLGLDEFLKGKGKVSKEELLDHLRGNALEIKEIRKGEGTDKLADGVTLENLGGGDYGEDSFQFFKDGRPADPVTGDETSKLESWPTREEALAAAQRMGGEGTKFGNYTLPGGENYRELLFQLPPKNIGDVNGRFIDWANKKYGDKFLDFSDEQLKKAEKDFKNQVALDGQDKQYRSSHFDEPNVLAHTRLNDRVDADGKRVLFVEEIQSDWHQAGRKKGYKSEDTRPRDVVEKELNSYEAGLLKKYTPEIPKDKLERIKEIGKVGLSDIASFVTPEEQEHRAKLVREFNENAGAGTVPDAPFRKTWHEFVLKRLIREAAEKGYDKLAWTTGEQQAERYDLSKQVDAVFYSKAKGGGYNLRVTQGSDSVITETGISEERLEALIGKDIAKKIVDSAEENAKTKKLSGLDLKVGGEGMKGFYDKILPEFANKFGKKYGAKVSESEIPSGVTDSQFNVVEEDGHYFVQDDKEGGAADGRIFDSEQEAEQFKGTLDQKQIKVHSLDITPALKEAALNEGFSLFQGDENSPRGRLQVDGKRYLMDIFAKADKSTVPHELAHYFLEVMGHLAQRDDASPQLKGDYATALKEIGYGTHENKLAMQGEARDIAQRALNENRAVTPEEKARLETLSEPHENFARSWEKYLATGEAPSAGLRRVFSKFKQWLVGVYKDIKNIGINISPELKGVMDRMLATDTEIKRAARISGYDFQDLPDVPKELKSKIQDIQDRAREKAETTLLKPQMEEITAEHEQFLAERKAELTTKATEEVKQLPIFQAINELQNGGERKKNPYAIAEKGFRGELKHDQSVQLEVLAQKHGFDSAEDLAGKILEARDNKQFDSEVKARVDAGMEEHAALKDTALIREKALEAIHNDLTTELLALEREYLGALVKDASGRLEVTKKNRVEAKVRAEAAQESARKILADKPIKEAGNYRIYVTQERNSAVKAAKAIAAKDYEAAAQYKNEQLMNHALAAEAMRNRTEIAKTLKGVQKYARRGGDMLNMPYGAVRQIDQIMGRYELAPKRGEDSATLTKMAQDMASKGKDAAEIANRTGYKQDQSGKFVPETLPDFVARMNDNYYAMAMPDSVMGSGDKPYKDIPLKELREMKQAADAIAAAGKYFDRFLDESKKQGMKDAAAAFRASVEKNFGAPFAGDMQPGSSHATAMGERISDLSRLPLTVDHYLDTMLTIAHKLDGLKEGPAKEFIYRPFAESEARKIVRTKTAMEEMEKVFAKNYKPGEFKKYKDKRIDVGGGRFFTKENILSMALNWGNEGNRQRLMDGFKFDEAKMHSIFKHLGANDWQFAQDTWDHIDKYWPEISKLEMEVNGSEPGKVKPLEFTNEHGTFKGGYYPISYDFEKSADAYKNTQSKDALFKKYSTAKAATEQGHAEARVANVNRPLRLSLDVLTDHHRDVIHDLEFRKAVIDTNRFLNQSDAKAAIINAIGIKGYSGIGDWLKYVAGGTSEPLGWLDRPAQRIRFATSFYLMAYRIGSIPKIALENALNVSDEVGLTGAARVMKNYLMSESGMHEKIVEMSPFMKQRAEHLNRDIADITEKYRGQEISGFKKYAFFTHAYIDQAFSFPLFADTYQRAMTEHGDSKLAVNQAEESVKRTFMSGGSVDQPAVMRGGEKQKLLTIAYGYQSMLWNRFSMNKFDVSNQWAQGNHTAAAAIMARTMMYRFFMPAMVVALTRELLHNGQSNNPNEQKKRLVASALEEATPLKYLPVINEVANYEIRKGVGLYTDGIHFSPVEEALATIFNPGAQLLFRLPMGKPLDKRFAEESANALSLRFGVPKSVNDLAFNFLDWQKAHGSDALKQAILMPMARHSKK